MPAFDIFCNVDVTVFERFRGDSGVFCGTEEAVAAAAVFMEAMEPVVELLDSDLRRRSWTSFCAWARRSAAMTARTLNSFTCCSNSSIRRRASRG